MLLNSAVGLEKSAGAMLITAPLRCTLVVPSAVWLITKLTPGVTEMIIVPGLIRTPVAYVVVTFLPRSAAVMLESSTVALPPVIRCVAVGAGPSVRGASSAACHRGSLASEVRPAPCGSPIASSPTMRS